MIQIHNIIKNEKKQQYEAVKNIKRLAPKEKNNY